LSEEEEDEVESDGVSLRRCIAFRVTRADSTSCSQYETFLSVSISLSLRRSPLSTTRIRLIHTSMNMMRPPPRTRSETDLPFLSVSYVSRSRPRSTGFLSTYALSASTSISTSASNPTSGHTSIIVRPPLASRHTDPTAFTLSPCFNLDSLTSSMLTTTSVLTNTLFITTTSPTDYGLQFSSRPSSNHNLNSRHTHTQTSDHEIVHDRSPPGEKIQNQPDRLYLYAEEEGQDHTRRSQDQDTYAS
jgi:hypothetical protein